MKSKAGYFLAPIPVILGLAIAGWLAWTEIAALQNALTRMVVPGTSVLTLHEAGTYTIFHEADSVVDGKLYSAPNIAGLSVSVTAEANGQAIAVVEPGFSSSYSIGGHSGKSVLAFDIAKPGRYRLGAAYSGGRTEPQTVLAVSRGFLGRLIGAIFGAIGSVFAGFIAALVLVLTTYFRRRKMLRAAQAGTATG
ncbi:MAG TPA: hypothetical protein VN808_01950 [Stellaceae bacterium]|nr:hypothetical protein [Stellaceae bacterium]